MYAQVPFLWFFINMMWLLGVSVALTKLMRYLAGLADGALTLRVKVNQRVHVDKLEEYLKRLTVEVTDAIVEPGSQVKKVTWVETDKTKWGDGEPPKIEAQYDAQHGFLLLATFQINKRNTPLGEGELIQVLFDDLRACGVLVEGEEAAEKLKKYGHVPALESNADLIGAHEE